MSTTIVADVSVMFAAIEPCYVSGSKFELGDSAARITWDNALRIAKEHDRWLTSPLEGACQGMRDWASSTGAWEREEIAAWSADECLALFAQNVASEMRMLGSDDSDFETCAETYASTEWDSEPEYPMGHYFRKGDSVCVEYYTGM